MANNNNICRNIDDDDDTIGGSTWASMSLAISDQGTCTKHPNVILREVGPDGFVYQKESCPECDLDFQNQKDLLKEQKRELDMQLEQLNNEEVSSHDEDDAEIAAPEPKNSSAQRGPSPFAPRFHVPPANDDGGGYSHPTNLSLESLANQMTMMQQMQDWMLQQKETEMATLRNKVEAQQKELLQKEVEIALLREKLSQQERRMHQEIKMAKLSAVASRDRKAEKESRKKGKGGNKEIHIQELHVQVGTNLGGGDGEFDPKVVQAATKAATTAALEKAAHAAEEHEERELQLQLQQAAATTASNGSGNSQPLVMKPPPTMSNRKEEDSDNSDFTKKKSLSKASSNMEFTFVPPGLDGSGNENSGKITGEEEFDEEESKDQFNPSSLPWSAPKLSKGVSSKKSFNNEIQFNPNTMTKNEPEHNNRTDPMRATMQSMAAPGTAGLNIGDTGLPTKKSIEEKNGNGPRGIPLELHYDDDNLDVPINEDVTIGTMDQQFFSGGRSRAGNSQGFNPYGSGNNFPMHNDDERSVGGMSLGNTVASSTYGEDRQKVVSQTLLDPYGDKGRYSGVVLVRQECPTAWAGWSTKTTEEPTKEIGATAAGMDSDVPPLRMAIPTKANTDLINDMDAANTVGPTEGFTTENSRRISDTAREPSSGPTEPPMRETSIKDNEKDMEDIPSATADTTQEVGWTEDTKDLENVIGKTVENIKANGVLVWHMVRVLKPIPMDESVMTDNGSMMNPFV
eukprot:CAMPEP_0194168758 /NCGR_PEP_ID=MMETSP0154-20130528/3594_1 /TAXON_ID=1049557 /ORGANISM="Thalassiothrix antarctica, Strain L6-D1" /LENGTH=739 /DNA_ID=CAMNT_0038879949 /DNA_START=53 /DNA_END=2273 /DNA_ORIENTATION=-